MADSIVSYPGQNQGSGDTRALFAIKFLTEVLTAYQANTVTDGRFMEKTIQGGKSAKFPVTGLAGGGMHVPGTEILGRKILNTEKTINIDDLLITDSFVAQIDEMMLHYDVRAPYTDAQGKFLAKSNDVYTFLKIAQAARSAANIPGSTPGGSRIVNAAMKTDASVLAAALFASSVKFDDTGIETSGRAAYLKPSQVALLVQAKETINKLYGGSGSYADGDVFAIAGLPIVKSAFIPTMSLLDDASITSSGLFTGTTNPNVIPVHARLDCSTTAGFVAQTGCIGTLKLAAMNTEVTAMPWRKGSLIVTSQALGKDVLRPECAIELATGTL